MRRRDFLEAVGRVGGAGAVYSSMMALGLLASPADAQTTAGQKFQLDGESGKGKTVLVLGAGVAGLCAAYELTKAGYEVVVLEARNRPGGRAHTIRRGTVETEINGTRQVCDFDEGQYFNPGPARIPQQHVTLDYCRELGVAVEPFGQVNDAAYYYQEGPEFGALSGKRVRVREIKADMAGYTYELLAKALSKSALDAEITGEDKDRLMAFLRADGNLSGAGGTYRAGDRRGYKQYPGAADNVGAVDDPYKLTDILRAAFPFYFLEENDSHWQPTLFQVVGGTDGIPRAFARRLGPKVRYEAKVTEIRQSETGVRVVYQDAAGKAQTVTGVACICGMPLNLLNAVSADFADETKRAIGSARYAPSSKVGLQFKRRFWEEDDRIFGGITRTSLPITQIFYPSTGYLGQKGTLVACYNFGGDALQLGRMTPKDRIEWALANGSKIHPQYRAEFETGFSMCWASQPFNQGAWAEWGIGGAAYRHLCQPDGRVYFVGDHLSYLVGWMAGAMETSRRAVKMLHERLQKEPRKVGSRVPTGTHGYPTSLGGVGDRV